MAFAYSLRVGKSARAIVAPPLVCHCQRAYKVTKRGYTETATGGIDTVWAPGGRENVLRGVAIPCSRHGNGNRRAPAGQRARGLSTSLSASPMMFQQKIISHTTAIGASNCSG